MILIDANLLLYAYNTKAERHKAAKAFLEKALSGPDTVALAWVVLLAFLRISTRLGVFPKPLKVEEALRRVDQLLDCPSTVVLHPGDRHAQLLKGLLAKTGTGGNLTTDGHLAALALEHGACMASCDHDFSRFPGLDWFDPLADS